MRTDWLNPDGASPHLIEELVAAVGPLPASYTELLQRGNGGEVGLVCSPFNLCLDSVESALDYWRSGTYTKEGVLVFATTGGGTYFAFVLSEDGKRPVICFDPISPEDSTKPVAADFEGLLAQLE